jgi:hypothetical protein
VKRKLKIALLILGACAVLFVGSGFFLGWLETRKELRANQLPDAAFRAITSDPSLVLMSLDPERIQPPHPESGFHGYRVLGETRVSDAALRRRLADTLRTGLDTWRFSYASCFNPRHGVRALLAGQVHEFVICFECAELHYYPPDGSESGYHGLGEGTAPDSFADILTAAKVPVAQAP